MITGMDGFHLLAVNICVRVFECLFSVLWVYTQEVILLHMAWTLLFSDTINLSKLKIICKKVLENTY